MGTWYANYSQVARKFLPHVFNLFLQWRRRISTKCFIINMNFRLLIENVWQNKFVVTSSRDKWIAFFTAVTGKQINLRSDFSVLLFKWCSNNVKFLSNASCSSRKCVSLFSPNIKVKISVVTPIVSSLCLLFSCCLLSFYYLTKNTYM